MTGWPGSCSCCTSSSLFWVWVTRTGTIWGGILPCCHPIPDAIQDCGITLLRGHSGLWSLGYKNTVLVLFNHFLPLNHWLYQELLSMQRCTATSVTGPRITQFFPCTQLIFSGALTSYSYFLHKDKRKISRKNLLLNWWRYPDSTDTSLPTQNALFRRSTKSQPLWHLGNLSVIWSTLKDSFPFLALLCFSISYLCLILQFSSYPELQDIVLSFRHNFPGWSVPFFLVVLPLPFDIHNWCLASCLKCCCPWLLFTIYDCTSTTSILFM